MYLYTKLSLTFLKNRPSEPNFFVLVEGRDLVLPPELAVFSLLLAPAAELFVLGVVLPDTVPLEDTFCTICTGISIYNRTGFHYLLITMIHPFISYPGFYRKTPLGSPKLPACLTQPANTRSSAQSRSQPPEQLKWALK